MRVHACTGPYITNMMETNCRVDLSKPYSHDDYPRNSFSFLIDFHCIWIIDIHLRLVIVMVPLQPLGNLCRHFLPDIAILPVFSRVIAIVVVIWILKIWHLEYAVHNLRYKVTQLQQFFTPFCR
jgi:hypothetical protein